MNASSSSEPASSTASGSAKSSRPPTPPRWGRVRSATAAHCEQCGRRICTESDGKNAFVVARQHVEQTGHTVTIKQLSQVQVGP